jgi:hypothetical protein
MRGPSTNLQHPEDFYEFGFILWKMARINLGRWFDLGQPEFY